MKIKIDTDILEESVTVDEYLAMSDGDIKSIMGVMSKFVLAEDGSYLPPADGRKALGSLTMKEMEQTALDFAEMMKNAVPKAKGSL